jgi:hypothetical protein
LALLPGDRLLCDDHHEILLFDLNDAPLTTLSTIQRNQPPRQQAVASFRLFARAISQPYILHDSIRFSVLTRKGIKGFTIPHSTTSPSLDCVDLLSGPINIVSRRYAQLGYNRAIICSLRERNMLQYAWPEEPSSSQTSTIQIPYCTHILFDEYSSRLICCKSKTRIESILLVDLAAL